MTKKIKKSKGLKGLSVLLMTTSLLPLTPIHAEENVQEIESEEIVEEEIIEEEIQNAEIYQANNVQTGWVKEATSWYYYDAKGIIQKGWIKVGNQRYYMDTNGVMQTGWNKIENNWYYMNTSGAMQTGWLSLNKNRYYLDTDGIMQTGHLVIDGTMYSFKPNGVLDSSLDDLNKNPTPQEFIDTAAPYAKIIAKQHGLYASVIVAQASLETGYGKSALSKAPNHNLFGIKGSYNGQFVNVYTKEDDGKGNLSTIKANFRKYPTYQESFNDHADKMINGVTWNKDIYTGTWRANTNNYTDATAALTGVYATDISYYKKLNSIIQRYKLYELDGDTLVTNPSLPKGWQKVDNNWYYIGKNGYKHTGWQVIDQKHYYMNSEGVMQTGWVNSSGKTYYMNTSGAMITNGWVKDNNLYYYMDSKGEMQTGWIKIKGKSYYLDEKGIMQTGWVKINNQWHYFNESGAEDISSPSGGVLNNYTAKRLNGPGRVETGLQVSREIYPDKSAKNVVLAGYTGEADALTGTLLASAKDAPLLLVRQSDDIKKELVRLGAENVYLLGGESVISSAVEQELKNAKYNVIRVAGKNRYSTAVEVAKTSMANTEHIFLTNDGQSGSLADALAIGPVSGKNQMPIMLTSKNKLPEPTLDAITAMKVKKVTIVGGDTVVSKQVEKELTDKNIVVDRISGKDRYETAIKIANKYFSGSKKAVVTNDGNVSFADALMGGYLGAKQDAPILLTAHRKLNIKTENYLNNSAISAYVLGGEATVHKEAFQAIEGTVKK